MSNARLLAQVALGEKSPDLLIENGCLVDVYSGRLYEDYSVAVAGGRIAWTGPAERAPAACGGAERLPAGGAFITPGFLDVHGHAAYLANPVELAAEILPLGTTGMLSDTHDLACSLGAAGLDRFLAASESIPFRYYLTLPIHCPPAPDLEGEDVLPWSELERFAHHERMLSVSEVFAWPRLLAGDPDMVGRLQSAIDAGLLVEGHTAGCSADKLAALAAMGLTSCHESVTVEDVLERLRLGYWTALRHGSIRSDLDVLARVVTENPGISTARLMLTPDWVSPQHVVERGYIDHLVEVAIEQGIPAMTAIQMVTINPAIYLRLDGELGGLAPGRRADLLLVEDLTHPRPVTVVFEGRIVARDGRLVEPRPFPLSPMEAAPLSLWPPARRPDIPVTELAFKLHGGVSAVGVEVPAIRMQSKTITRPERFTIDLDEGVIAGMSGRSSEDLLHLATWSHLRACWLTVPLQGFGARVGGLALSAVHENGVPLVVGSRPADMAAAVNRMLALGGGVVLVDDGVVAHELALDIGGVMSTRPLREVAEKMRDLNHMLQERGCPWDDPFFGLNFLSFTGLPYMRLTPRGLFDTKRGLIGYPP